MQTLIEQLFDHKPATYTAAHRELFTQFLAALNAGRIRAAEPDPAAATGWRVNAWVKKGILLGFRMGGDRRHVDRRRRASRSSTNPLIP